jgi:hypothetical protein
MQVRFRKVFLTKMLGSRCGSAEVWRGNKWKLKDPVFAPQPWQTEKIPCKLVRSTKKYQCSPGPGQVGFSQNVLNPGRRKLHSHEWNFLYVWAGWPDWAYCRCWAIVYFEHFLKISEGVQNYQSLPTFFRGKSETQMGLLPIWSWDQKIFTVRVNRPLTKKSVGSIFAVLKKIHLWVG